MLSHLQESVDGRGGAVVHDNFYFLLLPTAASYQPSIKLPDEAISKTGGGLSAHKRGSFYQF